MADWDERSIVQREFERRQHRPTEAEIHAEFKRRKGIVDMDESLVVERFRGKLLVARLLGVALVGLILTFTVLDWQERLDGFWAFITMAIFVITGLVLGFAGYRCPQCGSIPYDDEGGFDLGPKRCRRCGARLR